MKRHIILFSLLLVVLCGCTQNKEEYLEGKPNSNINTEINQNGYNKEQSGEESSGEIIKENEITSGDVTEESSRKNRR